MPTDLTVEDAVTELFAKMDALDFDGIRAMFTDDAQGVDEISRGWMRGREDMDRYFRDSLSHVSDVHSTLRDTVSRAWGDVGLVTGVLEQTYDLDGQPQQVTAPTTLVLVREGGRWKVAVVHSVPLAAEAS
jgi:ketosteroid isomerase-like protein